MIMVMGMGMEMGYMCMLFLRETRAEGERSLKGRKTAEVAFLKQEGGLGHDSDCYGSRGLGINCLQLPRAKWAHILASDRQQTHQTVEWTDSGHMPANLSGRLG